MKRILLVCFVALALVSCFEENEDMCLTLTFSIEDQMPNADGNFDSRVGNDILLTAFRNGAAVWSEVIPYERIQNGECTIKKPDGLDGNVVFVAWGVSVAEHSPTIYTPLTSSTSFDNFTLQQPGTNGNGLEVPNSFMFGTDSVTINSSGATHSNIALSPITCGVEVRVHSEDEPDNPSGGSARIHGTATHANLHGMGANSLAVVEPPLPSISPNLYSTGIVRVMPSLSSPTSNEVSVVIMDGTQIVATLTAPASTRVAARSGGYILFDYYVTTSNVTITVEDWQVAGTVTVNNM
ncbi:MAG: FimB/Mfa2 family fimbrial subunit [Mediterranea sp.]|jgi:hypothetical protein|nr:FimB/Mfa2 family fimbrial subunit [Mediterranea sp.]